LYDWKKKTNILYGYDPSLMMSFSFMSMSWLDVFFQVWILLSAGLVFCAAYDVHYARI